MPTIVAMPVLNRITRDQPKETTHRTLQARFGNGQGQFVPNGLHAKTRTMSVTWAPLVAADKNTVETALDSVGGWGTLTWTTPYDTVQSKWRLVDGKYHTETIGKQRYKITCSLEERFD